MGRLSLPSQPWPAVALLILCFSREDLWLCDFPERSRRPAMYAPDAAPSRRRHSHTGAVRAARATPRPTAFVRGASRRFPVSRRAPLTPISGYHPSPILSVSFSSCYDTSQGLLLPLPLPPRQRKNSPELGLGLGVVKAPELHAVHLGVGVRLSGDMAAHDVVLVVLRTRKTRGGGGDAGIERVSIFSGKKRLQRV